MTIYSTDDLANLMQITPRQAKALMKDHDFPSTKVGNKYLVTEDAIENWMKHTKEVKLEY